MPIFFRDLFQTQVAHCVTFPTWGYVCVDVQYMCARGVRKKKTHHFLRKFHGCTIGANLQPVAKLKNRARDSKTGHEIARACPPQ